MAALVLCVGGAFDGRMAELSAPCSMMSLPDLESYSMVDYYPMSLDGTKEGYSIFAVKGLTKGDVLARLIGHYQPHSVAIAP